MATRNTVMVLAGCSLLLSGCVEAVIGGAATTGIVVAQERSTGNAVDDTVIHANILHKFVQKDINGLFPKVHAEVHEGRVLLTGSVINPDTMLEAVKQVWQVEGVKEVINEIQVTDKSTLSDFAKDSYITTRLKSTLLLDRDVRSVNYHIETVNRVVYLFGIAQNEQESNHVSRLASTINGVKRVVSHVRLKDDPQRQTP